MDILYVSTALSESLNSKLLKELELTDGQQDQKFHRLMIKGLEENGQNVETISSLATIKNSNKKIKFPKSEELIGNVKYNYINYVNIPVIRNINTFVQTFLFIKRWKKNHLNGVILCEQRFSMLLACIIAKKIYGIKCYGVVTDLPIYHISSQSLKGIKKILIKFYNIFRMKTTAECTGFILLTNQMNNIINKKGKPNIVIEGFADAKMRTVNNSLDNKFEKKVCHYAGKISEVYGLKMLVNAFIKANVENSELHIFGDGPYVNELKKVCKEHSNIKYFGFKPNEIIVENQMKATLLVNPRFTNYEYTKYSFPSKMMEYMASGTPLLTTALPGIPKEYFNKIYVLSEENEEALSEQLRLLLNQPKEKLHEMGVRAKKFILENKNNYIQSKKIIKMLGKS